MRLWQSKYQRLLEKIIESYIDATGISYEHVNSVFNVVLNRMMERKQAHDKCSHKFESIITWRCVLCGYAKEV